MTYHKLVKQLFVYTKQRSVRGAQVLSGSQRLQSSLLSKLQDELQELQGVPGLALLPVPAHHWHLCPGALGKVYIQLHPLLCHCHGDLHLICLRAHSHLLGAGVFLWDFWRPA